jgi:hypothetical protein
VVEEYGNVKFDDSIRMCPTAPNGTSGSISLELHNIQIKTDY